MEQFLTEWLLWVALDTLLHLGVRSEQQDEMEHTHPHTLWTFECAALTKRFRDLILL